MKKNYLIVCILLVAAFIGTSFTGCKKEYNTYSQGALTDTIMIPQNAWTNSNGLYTYSYNLSSFTADVHFNGAYWAYISFDNEATYTLLGTTLNGYYFDADFDTDPSQQGVYGVTISAEPLTSGAAAPSGTVIIKVVSIPSDFNTSSVNPKDYNSVKAALHLN